MKKRIPILVVFTLFTSLVWGQYKTPLSLISTSGGFGTATINSNPATIEWTIGETFIGIGNANGQTMTIGEQQALGNWAVGIEETIFNNVKVYPNPANNYIKIDNLPNGKKTIQLTNITGQVVQSLATTENFQTLNTSNLSTGNYTIIISTQKNQKTSFKISITNN